MSNRVTKWTKDNEMNTSFGIGQDLIPALEKVVHVKHARVAHPSLRPSQPTPLHHAEH
jgi:hypothetical protein